MDNSLTFTLLGCGSSGGVPRVGNQWGNCDPENPLNRRRRCALLIRQQASIGATTTVLVDAGPDLREQLLASSVTHLDGVLLTHSHADHIFGLDDLRQLALSMDSAIPIHMDQQTADIVLRSFDYVFRQAPGSSYPRFCTDHLINRRQAVNLAGAGGEISAIPLIAEHGDITALGFKIGNLAYLPDVKRISDEASLAALQGLDILIIDALRHTPHPSHMHLDEALEFIEQLQPGQAVLTNMHTDLDYEQLSAELPVGVEPGFDGMELTLTGI